VGRAASDFLYKAGFCGKRDRQKLAQNLAVWPRLQFLAARIGPESQPNRGYVNFAEPLSMTTLFFSTTWWRRTTWSRSPCGSRPTTHHLPTDSTFSALKKSTCFSDLTSDQLETLLLFHALSKFLLTEFKNLSLLKKNVILLLVLKKCDLIKKMHSTIGIIKKMQVSILLLVL
jgi:hypothetical protein